MTDDFLTLYENSNKKRRPAAATETVTLSADRNDDFIGNNIYDSTRLRTTFFRAVYNIRVVMAPIFAVEISMDRFCVSLV